jgi:serine phosphatase RsbU (regulator of sigma subunit)
MNPHPGASAKAEAGDDRSLHLALQQSEGRRLGLLTVVLAVTLGLILLRHELGDLDMGPQDVFVATMELWAGVAGYTLLLWILLRYANKRGILLPTWFWGATTVLESLIPTAALLVLEETVPVDPFVLLAAPVMLLYGVFVVASILRLRPWLSLLAGTVCAAGHAALFLRLVALSRGTLPTGDFPFYFSYPVFLFLTGVVAAQVSLEVRRYFLASLREAEVRRQMDLMNHDLRLARTIQQGLLPKKAPDLRGYDIAGWSQPADETGGDYYDWQPLPDGRLAVSLADVTGHGIAAALVTAACRAYSRASFPSGGELGGLMSRVNGLLADDLPANRFVTFVVAVLDPKAGRLELLSAGHGPILVYKASENRLYDFPAQGIPFGITSAFEYGAALEFQFLPGDFAVLLTDGFFEWAGPGDEQFGLERLKATVQAAKDLPAQELIAKLYSEVREFARGVNQQDDLTAVVIKRAGSPA